jgi:REP element-mobilizing transposase RayT
MGFKDIYAFPAGKLWGTSIVGYYKSGVTKIIRQDFPAIFVWQKSFYDHIIRDEMHYSSICDYINNNLVKWELDSLF